MGRGYGGGNDSWGQRLFENLNAGVQSGMAIAEKGTERRERRALQEGTKAAYAEGGNFATKADYDRAIAAITKVHADRGDMEGATKAAEAFRSQLANKINDNLQGIMMAAQQGDMNTVARLVPETYSYLPNGKAMAASVTPDGKGVALQQVDEASGEPSAPGMMLDAETAVRWAAMYQGKAPDILASMQKDKEIAQTGAYQTGQLELGKEGLDVEREGLQLKGELGRAELAQGWAGIDVRREGMEQERNIAQAQLGMRATELGVQQQLGEARLASDAADRAQRTGLAAMQDTLSRFTANLNYAADTKRTRVMERQWEDGALGRETDAALNLAQMDKLHVDAMNARNGTTGTGAWNADDARGMEGVITGYAKLMAEDAALTNTKVDPIALSSAAMRIATANPSGSMGGAEALGYVLALKANPADWTVSYNGQGMARVTGKNGERFMIPEADVKKLQSEAAQPAGG